MKWPEQPTGKVAIAVRKRDATACVVEINTASLMIKKYRLSGTNEKCKI